MHYGIQIVTKKKEQFITERDIQFIGGMCRIFHSERMGDLENIGQIIDLPVKDIILVEPILVQEMRVPAIK